MPKILITFFLLSSAASFAGICTLTSDKVVQGQMGVVFKENNEEYKALIFESGEAACNEHKAYFKSTNPKNKIVSNYESYNVNGVNDEEILSLQNRIDEIKSLQSKLRKKILSIKSPNTNCNGLSDQECQKIKEDVQIYHQIKVSLHREMIKLMQEQQELETKLIFLD